MGLIKGFWIIVDLGKKRFVSSSMTGIFDNRDFFSSKYSTNYEQRSQYCGT